VGVPSARSCVSILGTASCDSALPTSKRPIVIVSTGEARPRAVAYLLTV